MIKQERKDSYLDYKIQAISQIRLKPALHTPKYRKEGIVRVQGLVRASLSYVVPCRTVSYRVVRRKLVLKILVSNISAYLIPTNTYTFNYWFRVQVLIRIMRYEGILSRLI